MKSKEQSGYEHEISIISRVYPPEVGGMQEHTESLVESLKKKNVKLNLILNTKGKKNLPFFLIKAFFKILTSKSDVYHVTDGVASVLNPIIKKIKKKPLLTTIHGLDITYNSKLYQFLVVPCIKQADKIVAVSEYTKNEVAKRGFPMNEIEVIPNALKVEKYPKLEEIEKNPNIMITVGRQVKRKGIAKFINTKLNILMEDNKNLKFYIIGTGPEKEKIKQAISNSKFKNRIFYLGRLEDQELYKYYKKAKFFVMPNIKVNGDAEGFGIVLLEAIHYKNIIIANPIEGIKDALRYTKNWININEENIMLGELEYQEENPEITWDHIIKDYLALYKELANKN